MGPCEICEQMRVARPSGGICGDCWAAHAADLEAAGDLLMSSWARWNADRACLERREVEGR